MLSSTNKEVKGATLLWFNSLPNDKNVDLSKLKAFADYESNVTQKLKFALERVENIVGKVENAGFSFSHNIFQRLYPQGR